MKAWININSKCNLSCKWCYNKENILEDISIRDVEQCVKFLKSYEIIEMILIGGEPTLHPQFWGILKIVKNHGMKFTLVTNGLLFEKEEFLEKFEYFKDIGSIVLSIKGCSRDEYLDTTQIDYYERSLKSIKNIIKKNYECNYNYVISIYEDINFEEMERFLDVIVKEKLILNLERPTDITIHEKYNRKSISDKLNKLYDLLISKKINFVFSIKMPFCYIEENFIKKLIGQNRLHSICELRRGHGIFVSSQLDIIPCNQLWNYKIGKIGVDFSDKSEYYEYINKNGVNSVLHKIKSYSYHQCRQCKYLKYCGGGCFLYHKKGIK